MNRVSILGIPVDDVVEDEAVSAVVALLDRPGVHHVVTVNPEFVVQARRDPVFRAALEGADLALPDGVGVVWAARVARTRLRGRATGVDTVRGLAASSARSGRPSLFLLGAAPGVAERAAAALERQYPGVRIVGCFAGSPRAEDRDAALAAIDAAAPDVLLVAYGAPAQDVWIAAHRGRLRCRVAMGVGGTFDYLAGVQPRAPGPVRRLGLEWLHRLVTQPWRWRRMLRLPIFAWLVLRERARARRRPMQ